ncbi:MAG: hypothetical protein ACYC6C_13960 [Coriobacteriia bacterium]
MPIRPEMKDLYPPDWRQIRARILDRAGNCCEWCRRPNGQVHAVAPDGAWCDLGGERWHDSKGTPIQSRGQLASCCEDSDWHATKTVLTIAHLDHDPTHNADDNLRALCQRCHLRYDAKMHASTARATKARKAGQGTLKGIQ